LRVGPLFTPVGLRDTLVFPGLLGGGNWSGAAFDPTTGILYVNSNNAPWIESLKAAPPEAGYAYERRTHMRFTDNQGYPAIKPPWGTLTALDLNRGEMVWQITLGELPELTARGIPLTGTENFGGAIVTAGGLVFIGATMDEKFRAFDSRTGRVLWEHKLPAGGYATPATYLAGGRQFVVIAAGGGGRLKTRSGDAFVAFALPEQK
jgi:quinoprotein glucose dehydrogenase